MRKKNPTRVLIMGYPYFVNRLRELGRNSEFVLVGLPRNPFRRYFELLRSEAIYLIGGDLRPNRFFDLALMLGKKVIVHWVGSDILEMRELANLNRRFSPFMVRQAEHWSEVEWTAAELAPLGITAKVVPLTPASFPEKVFEMPSKFVALTYLPQGKEVFYGERELIKIAQSFPEIVFLAAAASSAEPKPHWPANIIPIGWVNNMAELYREVVTLIRLTEHDGLSFMVLEALSQARYVVWSYPLTGVFQARTAATAIPFLTELYQAFLENKLALNREGREGVERLYRPEIVWEQISQGIRAVLNR